MKTITDRNIVLTFADKETANQIKLICKRKGTTIEDYILITLNGMNNFHV